MIALDGCGIPDIHGCNDADAVLGMSYAQAEHEFARIVAKYLTAQGVSQRPTVTEHVERCHRPGEELVLVSRITLERLTKKDLDTFPGGHVVPPAILRANT